MKVKHLSLKLLSLLISIGLFYFVNSQSNQLEKIISVPINIKNLPGSKSVVDTKKLFSEVTLRGPSFLIADIENNLSFNTKVPKSLSNNIEIILNQNDLDLPSSIQVINIKPRNIKVQLDDVISKKLKILIPKIGTIPKGFKLNDIQLNPTEAIVSGPKKDITYLDTLQTIPVDLRFLDETQELKLAIKNPSNKIKLSNESVNVKFVVESIKKNFKITNIKIPISLEIKEDYLLSTETVDLILESSVDKIKDFNKNMIQIKSNISSDKKNLKLDFDIPSEYKIIKSEPEKILLTNKNTKNTKNNE